MLADIVCVVMYFLYLFLLQNGIVTKDLTRLKMLLSEIEVSVLCEVLLPYVGVWAMSIDYI